jgi:heat shock protein HtpX
MEEIINSYLDFAKRNPIYLVYSGLYYLLSVWLLQWQWWAWLVVAAVYVIAMIITFSRAGEWLMRTFNHVRPLETAQEMNRLRPLFREVYQKAKAQNPELGQIELFIVDTMKVNTIALGSHTIAVSKGAMHTFSEEEMRAVLAHEIAHILYRDTMTALYAYMGNGIFMGLILLIKVSVALSQTIDSLRRSADFMDVVLGAIISAFLFLMQIAQARASRKAEKRADDYALQLGYGEDLVQALYLLEKMSLGGEGSIKQRLTATHPRLTARIGRLETALGVQVESVEG